MTRVSGLCLQWPETGVGEGGCEWGGGVVGWSEGDDLSSSVFVLTVVAESTRGSPLSSYTVTGAAVVMPRPQQQ